MPYPKPPMFSSLLDILKKAQREHPQFSRRLAEAEALARWETAVGPQIAKHARAIRVQDHTLFVEVDHPIWKQELQNRKRQILEKLNTAPPAGSSDPTNDPAKEGAKRQVLEDLFFVDPRGPGSTGSFTTGATFQAKGRGRGPKP